MSTYLGLVNQTTGVGYPVTDAQLALGVVVAPALTATNVVQPTAADVIPLSLRAHASQSVNLQEWQNSSGTALAYMGLHGNLVLPASTTTIASINLPHGTAPSAPVNGDMWTTSSGLYVQINGSTVALGATDLSGAVILAPGSSTRNVIQPTNAAYIPLTVKSATSQTADLTEWQNSSGTALATVDANGYLTSGRVKAGSNFGTSSAPLQTGLYDTDSASNAVEMFNTAHSSAVNTGIAFRPGQGMHYIAAIRAFTNSINGAADNTLRFYSAFDTTGAIDRTRLTEMMKIGYNYGTIITNNSAAVVALTVKGASSQTANLLTMQDSNALTRFAVSSNGNLVTLGRTDYQAWQGINDTCTLTTGVGGGQSTTACDLVIRPGSDGLKANLSLYAGKKAGDGGGSGNLTIGQEDFAGNFSSPAMGTVTIRTGGLPSQSIESIAGGTLAIVTGAGGGNGSVTPVRTPAGAGGAFTVTLGAGKGTIVAGVTGGAGGAFTFTGGAGGASSGSEAGAANIGGAGSSLTFTAGTGGNATNGSTNTGGAGGSITLTAGTGGTGSTPGANGSITLVHGGGTTYRLNVADTGVYVGANNTDTVFGYGALVATSGTTRNTALGYNAKARQTGGYSIAIGDNATTGTAGAFGGIAIGGGAASATTSGAIGIGFGADATGAGAIAIGYESGAAHSAAIALGYNATTTAANQFVVGGDSASITNTYLGNGVTNVAPAATAINATGGSGTDIAGAALTIAGGRGTGTGAGGSILFKTATAGTTGSSLNALVTRGGIDATGLTYLRGISGQTANLQEWQDNSSTVLASISAAGVLSTPRVIMTPVTANGATPIDSDVSAWADNTFGFVVGTGGRVFAAWKNSSDVYYVEMTAI